MQTTKITKALAGKLVTFQGYDNREYSAYVDCVAHGVAVITYPVFDRSIHGRMVVAYIADASRLAVKEVR
jgi:hypothetical protein